MMKSLISLLAAGAAVALLAGCSQAAAPEEELADGEFSTIVDGVLTVGLSPDYPPLEFLEGDKLVGADVELITEVANRLDLDIKFEHQKFDQLINSVRTERVDVVISGMSDSLERQKTLEFVDYYSSTGRFYGKPENADKFKTPTDVCGVPVAVSSKTDYFPALKAYSEDVCVSAGLDPIDIVAADSGAAARLQLDQDRAVLAVQGDANLAYFETTEPGKYSIVLDAVNDNPFGISMDKGNLALAEAIREQLQAMYDEGVSQEIYEGHNLTGIIEPVINGATK